MYAIRSYYEKGMDSHKYPVLAMTRRHALLAVACVLAGAAPLSAQQGLGQGGSRERVVTTPVRVDRPPVIDGHLDDDAWSAAPVISGFVQREPVEGAPVSERTEVRILMDADARQLEDRRRQRDERDRAPDPASVARRAGPAASYNFV